MESLFLLVPLALVFLVIAIKTLFWAINNGQYDDLDTEGYRILFDDDKAPAPEDVDREVDVSGDVESPGTQVGKGNAKAKDEQR